MLALIVRNFYADKNGYSGERNVTGKGNGSWLVASIRNPYQTSKIRNIVLDAEFVS